MATGMASTYYLRALENYPFEPSEVLENLTYALSYDGENPAVCCLMGQLQMNSLDNYSEAERYFELAIASEPEYACAYENLVLLYIHTRRFNRAWRVLEHASGIATVSRSFIHWATALILERVNQLKLAAIHINAARAEATNTEESNFLDAEAERLQTKIKMSRKIRSRRAR